MKFKTKLAGKPTTEGTEGCVTLEKGDVELVIHEMKDLTSEDEQAIAMLKRHLNGELKVTNRVIYEGEVSPSVWFGAAQFRGLDRIKGFVRLLELLKKPVQPL